MKRFVRVPGPRLLFFVALATIQSWAGTQNASVTGWVFNQSGAPVAGATIRLINPSIGFSQSLSTKADGVYTFSEVPPAESYVISVEKTGFGIIIRFDITVHVAEAKLELPPFLLQPAAQPGHEVRQEGPGTSSVSLDLVSTTVGAVVDNRAVHTLPLVGRDFIDLALLVLGTYPVEQGSVLEGSSLVVNGVRANMNTFLLDGADNNDYTINQSLPFQIVEAMQEFRVQTATSPAEYGRSGGAQINVISRRGTNSFHGTLFEFHRNSALSARNFFSAYNGGTFDDYIRDLELRGLGNPLSDPGLASLYDKRNPKVIQNQFGGNVGGPLAKDKLFGFFNWESFRVANPRPLFERVPGDALRSASSCPAFVGLQPPAQCDSLALKLYNLYPARNVPTSSLSTKPTSNFPSPFPFTDSNFDAFSVGQSQNGTDSDNFLGRIDWRVNARASMSFKHNIQLIRQIQGGAIPQTPTYPGNGTRVRGRNQNFSYNYVHQFTSRTTNEFRFGWNRFRLTTTALDAGIDPATLGFKNLNFHDKGLPTLTVGGFFETFAPFSVLGADLGTPSKRASNVWSWADSISLTRGRNTWKFGGEFRHVRLNVTNEAFGRGLITFLNGPFVAATGESDVASIARVCPPFLASLDPVFGQLCPEFGTGFDRSFETHSFNWYVQDQWRPWQNFTLNYGVRYEVNTAPVERRGRLVNFYPALKGWVRANSTTIFDPFGSLIGTAPRRAPRAGFETDKNDWSPRIGFAWDPWNNGKTVVRGSYALVFDQQPLEPSVNMLLNPPFVQEVVSFRPFFTLKDTFQGFRAPYSTAARDPNTRTPYVHQFHFGIERQFGSRGVFEVAYVGSAGHNLPRLRDISACQQAVVFQKFFDCTDPKGHPLLFSYILNQETTANSNFHSLQTRFDMRNFHGLQLRLFYQWAKSIDTASSLQPQVFIFPPYYADFLVCCGFSGPLTIDSFAGLNNASPTLSLRPDFLPITTRPRLPQDSSNIAGERGLSDFDVRHHFVANYIYDVPRWAPGIGSGWQLAGIVTAQSGQPYTVFADFFGIPFRPNVIGKPAIDNGNPDRAIDLGNSRNILGFSGQGNLFLNFDPKGFFLLPGNLGRNTFSGPGLVNFDFSIVKNTALGSEQRNLQFRVEFFNLFNTTHFRQPYSRGGVLFATPFPPGSTIFFDPFFGRILQARSAREIQLAIMFSF